MLVTEEQVEVLEGLSEEEGLLHVVLVAPNLEKGSISPNVQNFIEKDKIQKSCTSMLIGQQNIKAYSNFMQCVKHNNNENSMSDITTNK